MTQTSKFILRLLCGLAVCIVITIAAFVVWRVNLAHDVNAKLQAIRAAGLPTNVKELNNYHRLAKGYVIYSVGSDGHDDGGREKPGNAKSSDKTTYDLTFTVER
jgi:hypothetical protein